MDAKAKRIEVKVGIFVVMGLVGAAASILMLGADFLSFKKQVSFTARFSEVQGLFPGSVVSLSGLKIGNIKAITLSPDLKLDILMGIEPNFADKITEGAVVSINTQGALGDKYIFIKPGPPDAKPIAGGSILPSDEKDFLKLLTDREDGVARVVDLIKELHILVASVNQDGKTAKMISNMSDASEKLKTTITKIDTILSDVNGLNPDDKRLKKAMISLANVMEKVDKGQGTLGQLINDPSVYQALKNMLGPSPRGKFMKEMVRETIRSTD
jgi:phospholipid/cholesterol/gamma-HCH transport system substrate-binding protein